jgi:hypothetical protein
MQPPQEGTDRQNPGITQRKLETAGTSQELLSGYSETSTAVHKIEMADQSMQ